MRHTSKTLKAAGRTLQSKRSSSSAKSKAGKVLKNHQTKYH